MRKVIITRSHNSTPGISRDKPGRKQLQTGFTLIELLIVVAIILIIAAIAIPNFIRSKMAANESAAAENVRTITTAAIVYESTWSNGYPPSLTALGGSGTLATCDQADLVDPILATPPHAKTGYSYNYTGEEGTAPQAIGCGAQGFNGYLVTAVPLSATTGSRSFCADEAATLHFSASGTAISSQSACEALPPL